MNPSCTNNTGPPFQPGRITIAGFIWTNLSRSHHPIDPTLNIAISRLNQPKLPQKEKA
jgi:hypothetical protein